MQTPIVSARVNDLLPIILDYKDFTREPNTTQLTNKIMNFYGAHQHYGFLEGDSTKLMDAISDVR